MIKIWTDQLQPRNEAEFLLVQDIAHAQWKIRRARTVECGMMDLEMENQLEEMNAIFTQPIDEGTRLARAFKGLGHKSRAFDHLHRYETRARRAFKSGLAAVEQLSRLTATPVEAAPAPQQPKLPRNPGARSEK